MAKLAASVTPATVIGPLARGVARAIARQNDVVRLAPDLTRQKDRVIRP